MQNSEVREKMDPVKCVRSKGILLTKNDLKQRMVSRGSLRYIAFDNTSKAEVIRSVARFGPKLF